jgi:hypothetical protein
MRLARFSKQTTTMAARRSAPGTGGFKISKAKSKSKLPVPQSQSKSQSKWSKHLQAAADSEDTDDNV